MQPSKTGNWIQVGLAGILLAWALLTACSKDFRDVLAQKGSAFGIAYPSGPFSAFRSLSTFSIAYPDGEVTDSPVTDYATNKPPCIIRAGLAIRIEIVCYDKALKPFRQDRLSYVADFVVQGYTLLASVIQVPAIELRLIEVSPQVTEAGFDLRTDIEKRKEVYRLIFFLPYTELTDFAKWLELAQDVFHELTHFAMWEQWRYTETTLRNEFIAFFIADKVTIALVYPKVLAKMRLEAPRFEDPVARYQSALKRLSALENESNFEGDHYARWMSDYQEVLKLARTLFWVLRAEAHARCIAFTPILKNAVQKLFERPESPSLAMQQVYEDMQRDTESRDGLCPLGKEAVATGEYFENVTFTFK